LLNLLNATERQEIVDYCQDRYAVDPVLWEDLVLKKSSEAVWAFPVELNKFLLAHALEEAETSGLRILSGKSFPYKITDSFLALFRSAISKGIIELKGDQVGGLLFDKSIELEGEHPSIEGYVILKYRGYFLGVGLKRGSKIESQIPKKLTNQLSSKLEFRDK